MTDKLTAEELAQLPPDERQFLQTVRDLEPAKQAKVQRLFTRLDLLDRFMKGELTREQVLDLLRLSADDLIAEARANRLKHAILDRETLQAMLPDFLHAALDSLLQDFDYDSDPGSGQGQAARILATIITALSNRPEIPQ